MGIKIGIDLGTTYCAVAMMDHKKGHPVIISNSDGEKIIPSAIQFTKNGEIIVGQEAKEAFEAGESGCASSFKRKMGDPSVYCSFYGKSYTSEDLACILLSYLKEETESVTGEKIDEVVITVPAYFYHKERAATMRAAKRAGLKVRQIINEPTAAAMNYAANHWRENARILVYDLGGGTFDVTLVQMKKNNQIVSLRTTGDHALGGKDWDSRICNIIEEKIEAETGCCVSDYPGLHLTIIRLAETVKKQLSHRKVSKVALTVPDYGRYETTVTIEEFEENTADLLGRTGAMCQNILDGLGIGWREITDILLVGGSTRMPQVSNYLKRISGHTPLAQVNPDEAVALGAAIQVNLDLPDYQVVSIEGNESAREEKSLFKFKKTTRPQQTLGTYSPSMVGKESALSTALSIHSVDVVAHAMGVIAINAEQTHYINKTIVPDNQKIPAKCAEEFLFYTSPYEENELEIYMLQGTKAPVDCVITGKYVATGIKHDPKNNPTTIKIQYSYDVNGMIHVQARQGNSQYDLSIREEPVPEDMSEYGRPIDPEKFKPKAEPLNVVMAVDVSGSMSGTPLEDAKKAMINFVKQFGEYPAPVKMAVVVVADTSLVVQSLTSNLRSVQQSFEQIEIPMVGYCNDGHPFHDIKAILGNAVGKKIGLVLADGVWSYQDVAIRAAKECHAAGIDIAGIGFGKADEKFLKAISSGTVDAILVKQDELVQTLGKIAQEIGGNRKGKSGRAGKTSSALTWLATGEKR